MRWAGRLRGCRLSRRRRLGRDGAAAGEGEVNGFAFRTSLFPDARGGFYLLVNRAMQAVRVFGWEMLAEFRLEADLEPREAELPDELAVLLDDEPGCGVV